MTRELGVNASRMDRRGADATPTVPAIELHCKQNIGGLRSPISDERLIGCSLEVRVIEVDIRETMAGGGEIDQASSIMDEWSDPVDENEMT
jgi:hypothetical protein